MENDCKAFRKSHNWYSSLKMPLRAASTPGPRMNEGRCGNNLQILLMLDLICEDYFRKQWPTCCVLVWLFFPSLNLVCLFVCEVIALFWGTLCTLLASVTSLPVQLQY